MVTHQLQKGEHWSSHWYTLISDCTFLESEVKSVWASYHLFLVMFQREALGFHNCDSCLMPCFHILFALTIVGKLACLYLVMCHHLIGCRLMFYPISDSKSQKSLWHHRWWCQYWMSTMETQYILYKWTSPHLIYVHVSDGRWSVIMHTVPIISNNHLVAVVFP